MKANKLSTADRMAFGVNILLTIEEMKQGNADKECINDYPVIAEDIKVSTGLYAVLCNQQKEYFT